jgi:hypothetical protein
VIVISHSSLRSVFCKMLSNAVFMDMFILDISYEWIQIIGLFSIAIMLFFYHLCYSMYQYFIPFHCWLSCHCLDGLCFLCLLIIWIHSCGFNFLAIMNKVGKIICVHVLVWIFVSSSLDYVPMVELLCHVLGSTFLDDFVLTALKSGKIKYYVYHNMR